MIGIIWLVEMEDKGAFNGDPDMLRWHDCFYYVGVTLSTVGYGDIIPVKPLSRIMMVGMGGPHERFQ